MIHVLSFIWGKQQVMVKNEVHITDVAEDWLFYLDSTAYTNWIQGGHNIA